VQIITEFKIEKIKIKNLRLKLEIKKYPIINFLFVIFCRMKKFKIKP